MRTGLKFPGPQVQVAQNWVNDETGPCCIGGRAIDGINNKIKVIKRSAYGFRDDGYFFLKIRQAFPGIP
jgi:hypothetical protein